MAIELLAQEIDTTGKGVSQLPDTPGLSAEAMQAKFDELPLLCVNEINRMVGDLRTLKASIEGIHSHDNRSALDLLANSDGTLTFDGAGLATISYVNEKITLSGGVVIPLSTKLLCGDGAGGVTEATVDSLPVEGSENPVASGGVYSRLSQVQSLPTVSAITVTGPNSVTLQDNHVYDIELGAYTLTLIAGTVTGDTGAHILLRVTSGSAALTIAGASYVFGDSLDDMGADQHWEISVYKQRVIIKNVTA